MLFAIWWSQYTKYRSDYIKCDKDDVEDDVEDDGAACASTGLVSAVFFKFVGCVQVAV